MTRPTIRFLFLILIATLTLAALASAPAADPATAPDVRAAESESSARAGTRWEPGPPVDPGQLGAGECLLRIGDKLHALPMLATAVELEVTGLIVRGQLSQTFTNPTSEVIEAVYVFPLPERAAVDHMEMRIGERRIVSVIQERRQARKTYEKAKRTGRKAALVESERLNLFTSSVANINPGETVEVSLEYLQELDYLDGAFRLAFPLTFTPRYLPSPSIANAAQRPGAPRFVTPVLPVPGDGRQPALPRPTVLDGERITPPFLPPDAGPPPRAEMRVALDPGVALAEVVSPSHPVRVDEEGGRWTIQPAGEGLRADCDFLLEWRLAAGTEPQAVVFTEAREDGRYALLMLLPPPHEESAIDTLGLATETLFVVDVSGSMAGPSIEQAREALLAALSRLRPGDRFNFVAFNNQCWSYRAGFVPATESALADARRWVSALAANGGTEIYSALLEALALVGIGDPERVRRIVFLTDGAVGNEDQVFAAIASGLGPARLHAIGIGSAPNRYLMKKMARFGRGACEFISQGSGIGERIGSFLARIDRPVMGDLWLGWEGVEPLEVYPARLPDLHDGEALLVSVKLPVDSEGGRAVLSGRLPAGRVQTALEIADNAVRGSGVATRWARVKVGSLMDGLHGGADPVAVRAEVIDVALAFRLVTKYTSLVAVERHVSAQGPPRSAPVPNHLPRGSQLLGGGLPRGGSFAPLRLLVGLLLLPVGFLLILAGRHWERS